MDGAWDKYLQRVWFNLVSYLMRGGALLFQAFVATMIWSWFITPEFSIKTPSVVTAAGICLLFRSVLVFAHTSKSELLATMWLQKNHLDEGLTGAVDSVYSMVISAVILLDAFVFHFFVS